MCEKQQLKKQKTRTKVDLLFERANLLYRKPDPTVNQNRVTRFLEPGQNVQNQIKSTIVSFSLDFLLRTRSEFSVDPPLSEIVNWVKT